MGVKIIEDTCYSYNKYKNAIINVYMDERLEPYYYPVLKEFLLSLCVHDTKVVSVYENKNKSGIHANLKNIYEGEGALQDLIIVPKSYSYDHPQKPYVTIEAKRPNIDIKDKIIIRYNKIKVKNHEGQLIEQFKRTNYIVFTDCITWYLLSNKDENIKVEKEICLIESLGENWIWKSEGHNFSNEYKDDPSVWKYLKIYLKNFIEQSKDV